MDAQQKNLRIMVMVNILKKIRKCRLGGITLNHKFNLGSVGFAKRYRRMAGDFNDEMDYTESICRHRLKP